MAKKDKAEALIFHELHAPTAVPDGQPNRIYRNQGDGLSEVSPAHVAPKTTTGSGWTADVGRKAQASGSPGMPGAKPGRRGQRPASKGNPLRRSK